MVVKSEKEHEVEALIDGFLINLKKGTFSDDNSPLNLQVAKRAAEILRTIVTYTGRTNIDGLLKTVRQKGKRLSEGTSFSMIIDNTTRRVMYIIREEYESVMREAEQAPLTPSLQNSSPAPVPTPEPLLLPEACQFVHSNPITMRRSSYDGSDSASDTGSLGGCSPLQRTMSAVNPILTGMMEPMPATLTNSSVNTQEVLWTKGKWKQGVISHITEYIQELAEVRGIICDQAREHLYENEVVLTLGYSHIVEHFAKRAAEAFAKSKRKQCFEVIVAEGSPKCGGHRLAKNLATAGIKTTVIPDSAVYATMSRVTKVLLGVDCVLADGGIIAESGCHMTAVAAEAHRTPLVCLAGLYRFCPVFPGNAKSCADLASPATVLPFQTVHRTNLAAQCDSNTGINPLHVRNPQYDYVPPKLIHTYVTNHGALKPSYVYRLLAEMYNPEDADL